MPSPKGAPFNAQDIPSLSGYVAIVTGGNSGIGYEATLQLALHGARVYIAARSLERITKAIAQMKASTSKHLDLHPLSLNLQKLSSVKEAAETYMRQESRLDLLINNAGIMATPFELTEDGFELQWQTNYLAPFMLTNTLLPILESTAAGTSSKSRVRIVNVSGDAAFIPSSPIELDFSRPNLDYVSGTMAAWRRYGHSKIACIVHARALHNRLSHQGISAFSLHPGIIYTNLQAADTSIFPGVFIRYAVRWGIMPGVISLADGARTTLFCATSPRAVENSGGYIMPYGKVDRRPDKWNNDDTLVGKLWDESVRMLKEAGF